MMVRRLLRIMGLVLLPRRGREFVLGDLEELHALRSRRNGSLAAGVRAIRDLLGSAVMGRAAGSGQGPPPRAIRTSNNTPLADLGADIRQALSSLRREKRFTAVTVATLGLGLGSVASVFGMVNQLILAPLPGVTHDVGTGYLRFQSLKEPDAFNGMGIATLDFDAIRDADLFDGIASYGNSTFYVSTPGERPLSVWANTVYGDYFEVLDVRPLEGRLLSADDTRFGADPRVAVISEGLRDRLFGPGQSAVDKTIDVGGHAVRVLGVTADGFAGAERAGGREMWVTYPSLAALTGFTEERLLDRNAVMHDDLIVQMHHGATGQATAQQVANLLSQLGRELPEHHREYLSDLRPTVFTGLFVPPSWRATTRRTLSLLAAAVLLVLLVACTNVVSLMLVRNEARRRDAAVRRALGASSGRIARSQLVHSLALAGLGSAVGLGVAWAVSLPLRGERLLRMPDFGGFIVDWRVLLFAVGAAVFTTTLFGLPPAIAQGRFDLSRSLRAAGDKYTGRTLYLHQVLSLSQVAMSLALLIGSLLLTRTVSNLYSLETGMVEGGVAVVPLSFPRSYSPEEAAVVKETVLTSLESVPGVESVAAGLYYPHGGATMSGRVHGGAAPADAPLRMELVPVTAGWFALLGMRDSDGNALRIDPADWHEGRVVLTEALATRLFGSPRAALGRTITVRFFESREAEIVAVTSELRSPYSPDESRSAVFVPYAISPSRRWLGVLVRASRTDESMREQLRHAVEAALPDHPIPEPTVLADRFDDIHSEKRLFRHLFGLLAAFTVALSAIGLYGVVGYAVARRRREFGIRVALGANTIEIAKLVARYATVIVGFGTALGLLAGYGLSLTLQSRLFGVTPGDMSSYVLAAACVGLAALVACWAPIRHATGVDPATSLRSE